jgi:outer membrane receptor protein involved in Fe transport
MAIPVHRRFQTPASFFTAMKTRVLLPIVFALIFGSSLFGQQSSPATSGTAPGDQPIQLSPFEVSSEAVQGYATTSSTSASRIAVPITELSNSTIVINENMINDLQAITLQDTLDLVGGLFSSAEAGSFEQNNFSMRGYTQAAGSRDGFSDDLFAEFGGFDYVFVERLEVSKGPNGMLYGEHSPGGVVNIKSKRPLAKPRTSIGVTYGSDNLGRFDFDNSGHFDSKRKFGYRFSAAYMNTDGVLDHPGDSNKPMIAYNPVVSYKTDNGWEFWAWYGYIKDEARRLRKITRTFLGPNGSAAPIFAIASDGGAHNVMTNRSRVETDNYELGVTKTFHLGPVEMDLRLLGRYTEQLDSNDRVRTVGTGGGTDTFVDADGVIIGRDSRTIPIAVAEERLAGFFRNEVVVDGARNQDKETTNVALDLNLRFKIGPTHHRLLAFGGVTETDSSNLPGYKGFNYTIRTASSLQQLGVPIVNGAPRVWLYPLAQAPVLGISIEDAVAAADEVTARPTTIQNREQEVYGFIERMSLLDNRLFLIAGARHTQTDATTRTGLGGAGTPNTTSDGSWTRSYGAVYKLLRDERGEAALYYNFNETFIPVFTIDERLETFGQKLPNRFATVNELGLKFDLLRSRLVATFGVFETVEDNVLQNDIDEDGSVTGIVGNSYPVPIGERTSKGWDVDVSYNILPGLDTVLSYGRVNARLDNGMRPAGQPDATASALLRYERKRGALRGASILWHYKWWGDSILNTRTNWSVPDGDSHALVLGYRRGRYSLSLRVDNIFDKEFLLPGTNETAVAVTNDRSYRLSLRYVW